MSYDFNIEVGKKLYDARKSKSMTRTELGKILNLHESTIKRYEDGEIKNLGIEKLKEFAHALGVDPGYLMGWDSDTTEEPIAFKDVNEATEYLIKLPAMAAYGGYDIKKMSDEEIIEFANEILHMFELIGHKYKK